MPILQPLESMERISRQALADDLDTVLERISREDIGLVITEEGKDDLVLCPASWFNLDYVDDFSCVINSALRYAMRSEDEESAAVVQYLRRHYQLFDEKTLSVAVADLERELNQPIVTLKQPQVWKELQELFRQRLEDEKQYELVEIQVDAELLEQLEAVIAPMGLTPEILAVKFFEFCVDPATQELAISLLLKWKAEQEAEGENLGGGL